jgi:molybdenum cofactor biosynthesis enzyme MoaA
MISKSYKFTVLGISSESNKKQNEHFIIAKYQTYLKVNTIAIFVTYQSESTRKKAELISSSKIYISNDIKLPHPLDRSTAGPGSGSSSIAFSFGNKNIKLEVSEDPNESFSLQEENDNFRILREGEVFLKKVKIKPILFHAPGQAFFNLEDRCIYNCAFCSLPKARLLKGYNKEKFVKLILKAANRKDIHAISLTAGIYPNITKILQKICYIILNIRENLPDISIGVETCIFKDSEILTLKNAGADEIKINIQIPDKILFEKICPEFNYKDVLKRLKKAVEIFGKGKVASNIIYGIGESDSSVIECTEKFARMGVVPTLRKIRINEFNRVKLEEAVSKRITKTSADRILKLAYEQKKILEKYDLFTGTFNTMCHKCGCCDIVPFLDL